MACLEWKYLPVFAHLAIVIEPGSRNQPSVKNNMVLFHWHPHWLLDSSIMDSAILISTCERLAFFCPIVSHFLISWDLFRSRSVGGFVSKEHPLPLDFYGIIIQCVFTNNHFTNVRSVGPSGQPIASPISPSPEIRRRGSCTPYCDPQLPRFVEYRWVVIFLIKIHEIVLTIASRKAAKCGTHPGGVLTVLRKSSILLHIDSKWVIRQFDIVPFKCISE